MESLPLLSLVLLAPIAGAALAWASARPEWARALALGVALATLAAALAVVAAFEPSKPGFQLVESAPWIPGLNVRYMVGVDGLSVLFLPAVALLFTGVVLASWRSVTVNPRLYFSLVLLLEAATLGVLCSLDTILFFFFWELTLVPMYFLVSLWGIGPNRRHAAAMYTLVMLAGGVPLLFAFIMLALEQATGAALAWDLPTLLATPLPKGTGYAVFLLLLAGFGVKVPVFPFHTWLPVMAMEGPAGVTAVVTGMKLGAYGLIRFAVPLAPDVARELHWLLAGLGTVGVLYGAAAALAETNLRRMLAYLSLSHVGLVVLGIASFTLQGTQGAVLSLLNFTVISGGLFLLAGAVHFRLGSTDALNLGGMARSTPLLASFFLLLGLAGMGIPGTSGFPAELLVILSAVQTHTGAGIAALGGLAIGAAAFLGLYRRAFLGPVVHASVAEARDLRPRELAVAAAFVLPLLAAGIFPGPLLDFIRPAAEAWLAGLR